jgi:SAM-dependent methyltransferase
MSSGWDTFWRWEWFHREQWLAGFRERKRGSPTAFKQVLDDVARVARPPVVLDASCGFGLKTIVMKELALDVVGSDASPVAVEKARELAADEGLDVEYFVSRWDELPSRTDRRFDGVFNDALSWVTSREEFEASLQGFLGVLKPGGILLFMGAEQGGSADPEHRRQLLEELWRRHPRFSVAWTCERDGIRCTDVLVREKGDGFVDEHNVYLIEDGSSPRLETATIRQPVCWHWPLLDEMFGKAGFSKLETRAFEGLGAGGSTIKLNIATK